MASEDAAKKAITLARIGGAVLWICNTVDAAQRQYRFFGESVQKEFPIGLLHSRFHFWVREELENEWMERLGKSGKRRFGCILVSTQIAEQSVDLDADLLVTELAPTDMLLQRLGRLWRHEREQRPVDAARLCIIEEKKSLDEFQKMKPKEIMKALGSKAYVYAPFILLRTLELWKKQSKEQGEVSIPSQIQQLIESTYQERENESDSWQQLFNDWFGTDSAKKMIASRNCNLWQVELEDEEGVQTRLNEVPTVSVVLCRSIDNQKAVFIDDTLGRLDSDKFLLFTAQAIHKNLIKVPEYCFDNVKTSPAFSEYLYGNQSVGILKKDGTVDVKGLKSEIRLFYSNELGLIIEKLS